MSTFEPYSAKWYAQVFDRTEARYCEADLDRLRDALVVARNCIVQLSGGHGHDSEQALREIAEALGEANP